MLFYKDKLKLKYRYLSHCFVYVFFLQFFYNCLHIKRDDLSRYSNLSRNLFYLLVEKEINVSRKGKSKSSILDGKWESLTSFNGNMVIEVSLSAEQKCKSLSRVYYRVPLLFIFPRKVISISNDRVTSSLKYFSSNGKKRNSVEKFYPTSIPRDYYTIESPPLSNISLPMEKKRRTLWKKFYPTIPRDYYYKRDPLPSSDNDGNRTTYAHRIETRLKTEDRNFDRSSIGISDDMPDENLSRWRVALVGYIGQTNSPNDESLSLPLRFIHPHPYHPITHPIYKRAFQRHILFVSIWVSS